ncbi:serine hydrolase domain-containing protein [Spelaeicoccus albus]|uniref:CubicO group peptidase (Beta-lactamase class C family) n=1 Tax=Spelaeicoccus albus TaxID=1280376 RepID=A0A7Z0A9S7_9MICO|nr:serine hydrolase domain-containing protein [Spelaeicoccus albus]NYI67042.1 CubicO group peptidase (beta-lactamase class C family) [Spelaeicoccus albus]
MTESDMGESELSLRAFLGEGLRRKAYSAAAWTVGTRDAVRDSGYLGSYAWDAAPIDANALFDLASLTKPIAAIATMALVERGYVALDDSVGDFLDDYVGSDKADITVRQLLTHTSGLPGQVQMFRYCRSRDDMLAALRALPVRPKPAIEYSSQGFMLLGLILEAASGRRLPRLIDELVCEPAGMTSTMFNPPAAETSRTVATEDCPWRGRIVRGEVHDENAVVLGGVAGHAGLFSTAGDLSRLGKALLAAPAGGKLLSPPAMAALANGEAVPESRPLGFWPREPSGSTSGDLLSIRAFGHTGFTGTSLWIDPTAGMYFVLLTNRVHPSRNGPSIAPLRRRFHNLAVSEFA